MALKITKASDIIEVTQLALCVYAEPGVGKTSLGFTADAPLLLDFDAGAYRSGNRGDTVQVKAWADVSSITAEDLRPYKTVVVDTAGRALDSLTTSIISANPKHGNGGALTLQGYGALKSQFIAWTKLIRGFGLDVVLLAHSDEQKKGDEIIVRLDVQGGSKNEIYKAADVMGRLAIQGGKRWLNFNPTDTAFGKNPAQLAVLEVPNFATDTNFLAGVIRATKEALNTGSAVQQKAATLLADWKAKIDEAAQLEEFNALIPKTSEADVLVRDNVKRLLVKAGKDKGFAFDTKAKTFNLKQAAA